MHSARRGRRILGKVPKGGDMKAEMKEESAKIRLMCAKAQGELLRRNIKRLNEGASRGETPGLVEVAFVSKGSLPEDFPTDLTPYVPKTIYSNGKGGDDISSYWVYKHDKINLVGSLCGNLAAVQETEGAARDAVANNSLEASNKMIEHIAGAASAFGNRDWGGVARHAGNAIGSLGQVFGHLSAGN
jgi:hypothetical protein